MHIIKPIGSYFQVRLLKTPAGQQMTPGGIVLPAKAEIQTRVVEVLAAGPGVYNPFNGGRFEHGIEVGDLLYINQHAPVVIEHLQDIKMNEDEETYLVSENDVFAVYMTRDVAKEKGLLKGPGKDLE
jgi:co-chaperonin GroES (HSP10)